MKTVWLICTPV